MINNYTTKNNKTNESSNSMLLTISPWKNAHTYEVSDPKPTSREQKSFNFYETSIDEFVNNLPEIRTFRGSMLENLSPRNSSEKNKKSFTAARAKSSKSRAMPTWKSNRGHKKGKGKVSVKKSMHRRIEAE